MSLDLFLFLFSPGFDFEVFDLCSGVLSDLLSSRQCQIKKELHLFYIFKAACGVVGSQQPPALQLCQLPELLVLREFLLEGVGIPKKTPKSPEFAAVQSRQWSKTRLLMRV